MIGDVVALAAAWTAPALSRNAVAWERRALCSAAAVVVTMLSMHRAGLYRSRVCALRSTEAARTIAAAVLGARCFAACEWLAGSASAWPAIEGRGLGLGGGPRRPVALRAVAESETVRGLVPAHGRARRHQRGRRGPVEDVHRRARAWVPRRCGHRRPDASTSPGMRLDGCAEVGGLEALARRVGATGVIVVGSAVGFSDRVRGREQGPESGPPRAVLARLPRPVEQAHPHGAGVGRAHALRRAPGTWRGGACSPSAPST